VHLSRLDRYDRISWKPARRRSALVLRRIVAFVAVRFGSGAGITGTLAAAVIFAEFLFEPFMSIRVADTVERNALIWMVLGGFMSSELLGERPNNSNRDSPRGAPRT
jgi:Domain of unknown function (DUF4118)